MRVSYPNFRSGRFLAWLGRAAGEVFCVVVQVFGKKKGTRSAEPGTQRISDGRCMSTVA